jgi:hypothetical protein
MTLPPELSLHDFLVPCACIVTVSVQLTGDFNHNCGSFVLSLGAIKELKVRQVIMNGVPQDLRLFSELHYENV